MKDLIFSINEKTWRPLTSLTSGEFREGLMDRPGKMCEKNERKVELLDSSQSVKVGFLRIRK